MGIYKLRDQYAPNEVKDIPFRSEARGSSRRSGASSRLNSFSQLSTAGSGALTIAEEVSQRLLSLQRKRLITSNRWDCWACLLVIILQKACCNDGVITVVYLPSHFSK